jgi:hypothetical protein
MGNSTDSAYASDEENQKKKKNESEPIITDPSQLKNRYPDLLDVYGQESEITITGNKLVGTLIIDGYQGSKINVGNNENLHYL